MWDSYLLENYPLEFKHAPVWMHMLSAQIYLKNATPTGGSDL
jgi:hypothetical protein